MAHVALHDFEVDLSSSHCNRVSFHRPTPRGRFFGAVLPWFSNPETRRGVFFGEKKPRNHVPAMFLGPLVGVMTVVDWLYSYTVQGASLSYPQRESWKIKDFMPKKGVYCWMVQKSS